MAELFASLSTKMVISTRRSSCMDCVQRTSAWEVCCDACHSTIGAVTGSPSSSVPISAMRTVNGTSNPDMPSRCLRMARRVLAMAPPTARSANSAITVSAAPSLAEEPRVPFSMTLPK